MSVDGSASKITVLKTSSLRRRLRCEYPALPAQISESLIEQWAGRSFEKKELYRLTHMMVGSYIRHEMTDYEQLLKVHKLTKKEARQCVNGEVQDGLKAYRIGPPPPRIDDGFISSERVSNKAKKWKSFVRKYFSVWLPERLRIKLLTHRVSK